MKKKEATETRSPALANPEKSFTEKMSSEEKQDLLLELAENFTQAYRDHQDDHLAVREAWCQKAQFPFVMGGIKATDLIAGRPWTFDYLVGFNLELYANGNTVVWDDTKPDRELTQEDRELRGKLTACSCGYYYDYSSLRRIAEANPAGSPERKQAEELIAFWEDKATMYHYHRYLSDEVRNNLSPVTSTDLRYANSFSSRVCCYSVDTDTLLQLGIPGLQNRIKKKQTAPEADEESRGLYEGMLLTLDTVVSVLRHFEEIARMQADLCEESVRIAQLERMADSLKHLQEHRPATFHQALQLWWIYTILVDIPNYGRMDVWMGDFYAADLDAGRITEEEAYEILKSVYLMVTERRACGHSHAMPNSRIILGGMGRRNPENADRFARLALKVTRDVKVTEPQTTLRVYKGQDPELLDMALEAVARGGVYPILYNDEVHVPWVQKAYSVSREEAEQYVPEGCGEIMIDHKSIGSPNNILNYLTGLDLVLHNGFETDIGEQRGLQLGSLEAFDTFEKLVDAWKKQTDFTQDILAKRHAQEHRMLGDQVAFNLLSILSDDCLERGRSLFNGGIRYKGGIIESFGLTNVADSLWAIKEMVFTRKAVTLPELVKMLDANWKGYEKERRLFLNLPKFGNDHEGVDELHRQLSDFACRSAFEAGKRAGLDFFLICNLNPGGGYYRERTKASADGRFHGESMAFGNNPTAGRDQNGLTSLLNSFSKNDHLHSGYVHNIKMSSSLMRPENRGRIKDLIETYFENNGCQLMITVINEEDFDKADKEPEKYKHLIVRLAGWCTRYIDLSPHEKKEVRSRTFYS
jgi:pyruvate-formate lyase